jgi:hypothetical protein
MLYGVDFSYVNSVLAEKSESRQAFFARLFHPFREFVLDWLPEAVTASRHRALDRSASATQARLRPNGYDQ